MTWNKGKSGGFKKPAVAAAVKPAAKGGAVEEREFVCGLYEKAGKNGTFYRGYNKETNTVFYLNYVQEKKGDTSPDLVLTTQPGIINEG